MLKHFKLLNILVFLLLCSPIALCTIFTRQQTAVIPIEEFEAFTITTKRFASILSIWVLALFVVALYLILKLKEKSRTILWVTLGGLLISLIVINAASNLGEMTVEQYALGSQSNQTAGNIPVTAIVTYLTTIFSPDLASNLLTEIVGALIAVLLVEKIFSKDERANRESPNTDVKIKEASDKS